jgi:hypothetical protein
LWSYYLQLVAVEQAFKDLKDDLAVRPIFIRSKRESRHTSSSFSWLIACMSPWAGACTPWPPGSRRAACSRNFAAIQMIDVNISTIDGRELVLARCSEPEPDLRLLLAKLRLELPAQPPPKITTAAARLKPSR